MDVWIHFLCRSKVWHLLHLVNSLLSGKPTLGIPQGLQLAPLIFLKD